MQRSEGVLTSIVMFFLLFLLVLYLFSTFNNNRVVESEPDRGEGEVTGDDDVTAQCRTHLATLPNDLEPVALLPPEEQSTDMADFIASLWPVARSPERAIRSALVAIEDRNQTSYTARFEDTTHFVEELSAGKSGEFYNFRLSTIDQDDQLARVMFHILWVPSRLEEPNLEGVGLQYCSELLLVRSSRDLGASTDMPEGIPLIDVDVPIKGWFIREDQSTNLPYDFSSIYDELVENDTPVESPE